MYKYLKGLAYFVEGHNKEVLYEKEYQQSQFYWIMVHSYCWFASLEWFRKVHAHHTFLIEGYLRYKTILCHKVALDV